MSICADERGDKGRGKTRKEGRNKGAKESQAGKEDKRKTGK